MPRSQDQLAKLSSAVFMCTVMGNSMPSLGIMKNSELSSNIVALGILIITLIVNICIQLGTGVIYVFWQEHVIIMFLMLVMLMIFSFLALTVPTTKNYLEHRYKKRHDMALKEGLKETDRIELEKLKEDLSKYWMMAHTCSPQFVMGRSATCTASGAFCLISALMLAEAMLRSYLLPRSFKFCSGESDYKWSTILVLFTQAIAIVIGTIAPAVRWFIAINFRCPKREKKIRPWQFKVERYWTQNLEEMKERPLSLPIQDRHCRKLAHDAKNLILNLCIVMQSGAVIASKLICYISIYLVSRILFCFNICKKLRNFIPTDSISNNDSGSDSLPSRMANLSCFVLHLEGEDELIELMTEKNCDAIDHWMQTGKRRQPNHLIELLERSTFSGRFQGIREFDTDHVPSLDSEEPPNCWALPVATLTSIAVALPNINPSLIKPFLCTVKEGLTYIKIIEDNLNTGNNTASIRKAADVVWQGIDLYHKWLDVDLHKLSVQRNSPKEILEGLADVAKNRLLKFRKINMIGCWKESPSKWPVKAVAANSMYRISQSILLNYQSGNYQTSERLFEGLVVMISDIVGACLSNIRRVIYMKCLTSTIEEREDHVRYAALYLGKTEKILKILENKTLPSLNPDQMACIDEWRSFYKLKNPQTCAPLTTESGTACSISIDLHLNVD